MNQETGNQLTADVLAITRAVVGTLLDVPESEAAKRKWGQGILLLIQAATGFSSEEILSAFGHHQLTTAPGEEGLFEVICAADIDRNQIPLKKVRIVPISKGYEGRGFTYYVIQDIDTGNFYSEREQFEETDPYKAWCTSVKGDARTLITDNGWLEVLDFIRTLRSPNLPKL